MMNSNLLFLETEPIMAAKRLEELSLLKFIHPRLKVTKPLKKHLKPYRNIRVVQTAFL
jgi:hypothetical protein